ncbi:hypothetical protein BHE90_010103 [Fusarium euwallaceae]|uniref:Uncharacterized protein n=1 Tax=Fusarium euwallaceae TaxID=1147111 RepID=A0A430LI95_9HYPO|nr:hypothetical protein BHE90_010103 [Fusarium euwallaceae]
MPATWQPQLSPALSPEQQQSCRTKRRTDDTPLMPHRAASADTQLGYIFFHIVDGPDTQPSHQSFTLGCIIERSLQNSEPGLADYSYGKLCRLVCRYHTPNAFPPPIDTGNVILFCRVIPLGKDIQLSAQSWHDFLTLLRISILNARAPSTDALLYFRLCQNPAIQPSPFLHILE